MSIYFKLNTIKLKNGKTSRLEVIESLYFPDGVWDNIKSFLPRPISKSALIIKNSIVKIKNSRIQELTEELERVIHIISIDIIVTREDIIANNNYLQKIFKIINSESIIPYFEYFQNFHNKKIQSHELKNSYAYRLLMYSQIKMRVKSTKKSCNNELLSRDILTEYIKHNNIRRKKSRTKKVFIKSQKDYLIRKNLIK